MALDEYLFSQFANFFKKKKNAKLHQQGTTAYLHEIKTKLSIIASASLGEIIEIYQAELEGGYKNNVFFLPEHINFFESKEDNLMFFLFRTLYLCEQKKLRLNLRFGTELSYTESVHKSILHADSVLKNLFVEFPSLEPIHRRFADFLQKIADDKDPFKNLNWLYGKWMVDDIQVSENPELKHLNPKSAQDPKIDISTIIKAKAIESIKRISIDKKAQEDYVLTHNFEKVETAEDFNGNWRDFDGEDELENHQNALDELSMGLTVRVDEPSHSIYQAEYLENLNISESAQQNQSPITLSFPEWDYKKNAYKKDFCKLYPERLTSKSMGFYEETIKNHKVELVVLKKILSNINNRLQQKRKQYEGAELDLDAVTDFYTDIIAKTTPSENFYIDKRKISKELSILILIDLSLSSDGYVQGKRILDLEKEIAVLFGEILHHENVDFSIAGFYSNTRNHTTFQTIKDFDADWQIGKQVIGSAEAIGYTRIGTAIRHATSLLSDRKNPHKWLMILSDGKPNDFDRYEGKYGVEDVKQALKELYALNINAYAYAIETSARHYLPHMFGANHFQIISSPSDVVAAFTKLFLKIKQSI